MGAVQCCEAVKDDSCAVADVSSWTIDHGMDIAKGTLLDRTATGSSATSNDPKAGPFWSSGAEAGAVQGLSARGADSKAQQLRLPIPQTQLRAVSSTSGRSSQSSRKSCDSPSSTAANGPASRINSPCLTDENHESQEQANKLARQQSRGLKAPLDSAQVLPRPTPLGITGGTLDDESDTNAAANGVTHSKRNSGSSKACEGRTLSGTTGTTVASEFSEKKGQDSDHEPIPAKGPSSKDDIGPKATSDDVIPEQRQTSREKKAKKEKKDRSNSVRRSSKESKQSKDSKPEVAKETNANTSGDVAAGATSEAQSNPQQALRRSDTWVLAKAGSKEEICFVLQQSPKSQQKNLRKSSSKESVQSNASSERKTSKSKTTTASPTGCMPFRSEPKVIQLQIPDLPPAEESEKGGGDMGPRMSGGSVASAASGMGTKLSITSTNSEQRPTPTLSPRSLLAPPAPQTSSKRRVHRESRRRESSTSEPTIFSDLGMTMQRSNSSTQSSLGRRGSFDLDSEGNVRANSASIAKMVALRRSGSVQSEQGTFADHSHLLASARELTSAITKGAKLVDLRRDSERRNGPNLIDSVHVEWENSRRAMCTDKLPDKRAPIIVFCTSGRRASMAKEYLCDQGYRTVLNAGGPSHFEQWQALTLTVGLAGHTM
mmetsp:Transcript_10410/g.22930  ORF Transcript_10410/g.22930 Transcript_10410/m.22930 type:complete len:658 (-) Transcript_10410:156-2129(-)|eukprot:CAMPEP_0206456326 /NCGR_PEP_ID=MMETSP0324_2-20121206/22298_1 /ASSEMBLY_ACC=CAM_ASM_000836 /TAXON_ID=2866 /ORGANISM="Crypthecodinium cohnii, Strain Seligo" /LENGTH=657 /DNA_ID=CAMNT_0053927233 /DNA_START=288 /DNA_END=2261 /DNA_ORIENTATION=-